MAHQLQTIAVDNPILLYSVKKENFNFCPRAEINFALFGFLLSSGMQLPTFNSRWVLYQIQLQSDHLIPELLCREAGAHFWNRTYIDYFLKVREGFGFTAAEMTTSQAYVVGREILAGIYRGTCLREFITVRNTSMHPSFDGNIYYFHLHLGTTSISCQDMMSTWLQHLWSNTWDQGCSLDFVGRCGFYFCHVRKVLSHFICFELNETSTSFCNFNFSR